MNLRVCKKKKNGQNTLQCTCTSFIYWIINIYPKANLQLLVCGLLSDMLLTIRSKRQKLQNLSGGWSSLMIIQGVWFYTSNVQISIKILLVSKFHNIDWIFKCISWMVILSLTPKIPMHACSPLNNNNLHCP